MAGHLGASTKCSIRGTHDGQGWGGCHGSYFLRDSNDAKFLSFCQWLALRGPFCRAVAAARYEFPEQPLAVFPVTSRLAHHRGACLLALLRNPEPDEARATTRASLFLTASLVGAQLVQPHIRTISFISTSQSSPLPRAPTSALSLLNLFFLRHVTPPHAVPMSTRSRFRRHFASQSCSHTTTALNPCLKKFGFHHNAGLFISFLRSADTAAQIPDHRAVASGPDRVVPRLRP